MTGILLLAAAIPLAAFIRHRLGPRRYVRREPAQLPATATTAIEVRR